MILNEDALRMTTADIRRGLTSLVSHHVDRQEWDAAIGFINLLLSFAELAGDTPDHTGLTEDERKYADCGQAIACIKAIRTRTGLGLKEAKALYDRYMR